MSEVRGAGGTSSSSNSAGARGGGGGGGSAGAVGRERAIETILDRDPRGCFYRAARVVEESVPQLLSSRPNLITRSALVEQAWSLQQYEYVRPLPDALDSTSATATPSAANLVALDAVTMERVIHHVERGHRNPTTSKRWVTKATSVLKTFCDENLLRAGKILPTTVEDALLSLCKTPDDLVMVHAAIVSLLTIVEGSGDDEVASDEEVEVNLPVAHLLALLEKGSQDDEFGVPREWLNFFAQTAAVAEERLEIQKARMLARLPSSSGTIDEINTSTSHTNPAAAGTPAAPSSSTPVETPTASTSISLPPSAFASALSPPDELLTAAATAQALTAAFEQVLSRSIASTLQDDDEDDEEEDDSSNAISDDDESDDDEDEEEEQEDTVTNTVSDRGGGATVLESSRGGVDETTLSEFDDDTVLRQALQLSRLAVTATASDTPVASRSEVISEEDAIVVEDEDDLSTDRAQIELDELLKDDVDDSSNLPPLPKPPTTPLPFGTVGDDTTLDPSVLSRFGSIPLPHVLLHLLRHSSSLLLSTMTGSSSESREASPSVAPPPGGMGSHLFEASTSASPVTNGREKRDDENLALHLIVASLILVLEKRDEAIAGLQKAVLREQQRDTPSISPATSLYASAVVEEEDEEDDPADTLAMNYVEDDVELSSESLENKGMRRKAAAAAYDAATLLKSLQKRTQTAKQATKLFSSAALHCVRTLRLFLSDHQGLSLSLSSGEKLSTALASLLSVSTYRSYSELLPNEETNVFLSLDLYGEAVWAWAESVPVLFSFEQSVTVLRSLIEDCTIRAPEGGIKAQSIDALRTPPSTEQESKLHKLQALCRRLRVSDVLDMFVSRPIPYVVVDDDGSSLSAAPVQEAPSLDSPNQVSSIMSMLSDSRALVINGARVDLDRLYLALCHRCHVRVLLMDGLIEDSLSVYPSVSAKMPKLLATGDTLKVSTQPGHALQFDAGKCADSMAILTDTGANGPSVNQRASKVWGSVLSTQYFTPKTGVHRFAVRLEKCERGHVFVGVSTTQASVKTYVGGDKHGWGMIGTQALWHDRRKIRGDYGSTFRTGSTIIVTLDTDSGTLSFGSWKDSSSVNSSFALDSSSQTFSSPRRSGQVYGTIEDWGVAFEGLPLDSKLYPAVGLYQRDDKVTLLSVECGNGSVRGEVESGCFFPLRTDSEDALRVRKFNDLLTWDSIQYAADVLDRSTKALERNDDFFVSTVLPSLASSLCLIPRSVPVLSSRFGFVLLPHLERCIVGLERNRSNCEVSDTLFCTGPMGGKWTIRATGSTGSATEFEEYVVDLEATVDSVGSILGFEGKGVGTTGKSKNGRVNIVGTFSGSSLTFVEEWSDGSENSADDSSSCVATARLSLDGKKFEGQYRNVQYGTSGQIVGIRMEDSGKGQLKLAPSSETNVHIYSSTTVCEASLSLALSHLATIVGEDSAGDLEVVDSVRAGRMKALSITLAGPLLTSCSLATDSLDIDKDCRFIRQLYGPPVALEEMQGIRLDKALQIEQFVPRNEGRVFNDVLEWIIDVDSNISAQSGGNGSLSGLCREVYDSARHHIIAVLLSFCGIGRNASIVDQIQVWREALQLIENVVRSAIAKLDGRTHAESCAGACELLIRVSDFLLSLDRLDSPSLDVSDATKELASFYHVIEDESDIELLCDEMTRASRRGLLRLAAFGYFGRRLRQDISPCYIAIECVTSGLPRLLGRGQIRTVLEEHGDDKYPNLDGNYLMWLSGARRCVRTAIVNKVFNLYESLGVLLDLSLSRENPQGSVCVDSLTLTLLSVFSGSWGERDVGSSILKSRILQSLSRIVSIHRSAILDEKEWLEVGADSAAVRILRGICKRDRSRSILHGALGVLQVLMYQVAREAAHTTVIEQCTDTMRRELELSIPYLSGDVPVCDLQSNPVYDELAIWGRTCWPTNRKESKGASEVLTGRIIGSSGLHYLRDHGTSSVSSTSPLVHHSTKASRKKDPPSNSETGNSRTGFSSVYFAHLIHVLCCTLRFRSSLIVVARDDKWMETIFRAIGMAIKRSSSGGIEHVYVISDSVIPARFRSRVLRALLPLYQCYDPSTVFSDALFVLAGYASNAATRSLDEDEWIVSREAVTLLRHLHSLDCPGWRDCVNQSICKCSEDGTDIRLTWKRIGVLCFFSGDVGSLERGSYVLLKPPPSAALSQEQQASPSSKGHFGGVGGSSPPQTGATPHHIVGNGTESIVAGLCRRDASAGIVSNVDLKNATCEVILIGRGADEAVESQGLALNRSTKKTTAGRHTLTVRALRTPLSDVVVAQEVPLVLDHTVPVSDIVVSMFYSSLERLLELIAPDVQGATPEPWIDTVTKARGISVDVHVLRACIVILSDKSLLSTFLSSDCRSRALGTLLKLAWPESIDLPNKRWNPFLSSLPVHEARHSHLLAIWREVLARIDRLERASEEDWRDAHEKFQKEFDESSMADSEPLPIALTPSPSTPASSGASLVRSSHEGIVRESDSQASNRSISQSTGGSNSDDDDENEAAAATAAAHLREAAIAQMTELGLPRSWSELALRRTGGTNIEAAVTFCLERSGDMERLLAEERERDRMLQRGTASSTSRRRGSRDSTTSHLLQQLQDMGFPARWCAEALVVTGNNVDEALNWILTNGERLSEEDEGMEAEQAHPGDVDEAEDDSLDEDDEDDDDDQGESSTDVSNPIVNPDDSQPRELKSEGPGTDATSWTGSILPLRFISGRSNIDPKTLEVSGLPSGGFTSVGTKGVLLTSGKWYYEAVLETAGCLQIGWADSSFAQHCNSDRGDGCGDGPSSWSFDGWRRYRWHCTATEWGCRWKEGDVVGCLVDLDERIVSFHLNGKGDSIGMGVAFSGAGFRPTGGVYACVSFNRREKLRFILGGPGSVNFRYPPPFGYRGVGDAVLASTKELSKLLMKESVLDPLPSLPPANASPADTKRFLCDFSDGEHGHELMAWAHRYYGSDASVHLGSARSKLHSQEPKLSTTASQEPTLSECFYRRAARAWLKLLSEDASIRVDSGFDKVRSLVQSGYYEVCKSLFVEIREVTCLMSVLLARKLILHLIITMGGECNPQLFVEENEDSLTRLLWKVIENCTSLRSVGWVGEAGSMAVAAEALGLGISSTEHLQPRSMSNDRLFISTSEHVDDNIDLPSAGITQFLSSVRALAQTTDTSGLFAACAEAAIGSDSGGAILSFLRVSLQSAACHSQCLRKLLIATIRRAVRLLSVVEYEGDPDAGGDSQDDVESSDRIAERSTRNSLTRPEADDGSCSSLNPDARLIAYLTGLLLSRPVRESNDFHEIQCELAECWSVGLLSASLPWRMICAYTVAGIMNDNPRVLPSVLSSCPSLESYFSRLPSSLTRRIWAERAASPVSSRYLHSMIELIASVQRAVTLSNNLPNEFTSTWGHVVVDSATPIPFHSSLDTPETTSASWEAVEGYVSSDSAWEVWVGSVELFPVDWKTPTRSGVRALVDAGQGPPRLDEGSVVLRGVDWHERCGNEDGYDMYEAEKSRREQEKQALDEQEVALEPDPAEPPTQERKEIMSDDDPAADSEITDEGNPVATATSSPLTKEGEAPKKKKRKVPSPRLPFGTVLSMEPWNGVPAMARRVRWDLTGVEGVYRFGGDGGKFDLSHVETNSKRTRVKKRHPLPESAEQCAARHGFGVKRTFKVLLRLSCEVDQNADDEFIKPGILEWPDFGSAARVSVTFFRDGSICIEEQDLLFGAKDSGWEARFGQPSYESGTVISLIPTKLSSHENQGALDAKSSSLSSYDELLGSSSLVVKNLRDRTDGSKVTVTSEMRLYRSRRSAACIQAPLLPPPTSPPLPLTFDSEYHASSISLSRDGRTASCIASDGRGTAFFSMGFTKGTHYWEVKLEQADVGSVFVGVAEKPSGSGSGSSVGYDSPPRLNRWHGWGFVNFRATYASGAERVYGAHCHSGDTIGVLLDCDAGRLSFFFDGLKYGEHILNDLGCAFETLSPFGFNVDGCGSGGNGQGAPSGFDGARGGRQPSQGSVRPKTLWPVVGLRNQGDRVTISSKWSTCYGIDGASVLRNVLRFDEMLHHFTLSPESPLPPWWLSEAYTEYKRWYDASCKRTETRGSGQYHYTTHGMNLDLDASPQACAAASASLGLSYALLSGDRVRLTRSAGRILELAEEAVVLGAFQGRLYYRIVSQKSEGGSLTEGGGRAWCWDESEVVDGLPFVKPGLGLGVQLPKLDRFRCLSTGGLRIVYEGGAVLRSDLEIFDGSANLCTAPVGTVIPQSDVLDRRVNSSGVVRYRVRYNELEGWISARIRGGKEEMIVETVEDLEKSVEPTESFPTPSDCALKWHDEWRKEMEKNVDHKPDLTDLDIHDIESFDVLASQGFISGLSSMQSDTLLTTSLNKICNFNAEGDAVECSFREVAAALSFALAASTGDKSVRIAGSNPGVDQAVFAIFAECHSSLPSLRSLLARIAVLRTFNRRTRLALPWISVRPCQEGSAILGGLNGLGTSTERAGRTRVHSLSGSWVQVPSISTRLRLVRSLIFSSVKRNFLLSITEATTTPTSLSHDEYELPREIRTVRINRLKAARAMESEDVGSKRKYSVFAQLQNEIRNWGGAALRRGYVAKGHGGQKRAFKVKLVGEGVNDYSGPYREAFADAITELSKCDADGQGYLGVLDRSPNNASGIGDNRDLYIFSLNGRVLTQGTDMWSDTNLSESERLMRRCFASLLTPRDEASREVEESLVFLGRITGTAFRHGIPVDLSLALNSVWKCLTEEPTPETEQLRELDYLAYRQLKDSDNDFSPLLWWEQRMLNSFAEGLGNVLPVELFPLFTAEELRDTLCGNPEVDVDVLRRVVEYEGYDPSEAVVDYFWQTLREFSNDERKLFLQFVWARNRLPMRESDFEAPFKIQRDAINTGDRADQALPSASTCFFSLTLPNYSSREILKAKLLFAINNVTTMETDFQTNSAEISEGYRTFS